MKFFQMAQGYPGQNLRRYRLLNGYTCIELARKSGVRVRYIQQLEEGLRKGTPNTWLRLSNALQVSVAEILGTKGKTRGTMMKKDQMLQIPSL
ncbi:MAG: helix-turn-helix transcriptional regulator [Desulfitobacterium hafniense]|nr:helix-turn-helix transcriptional regulator [Desulfitobacterium hafniense]